MKISMRSQRNDENYEKAKVNIHRLIGIIFGIFFLLVFTGMVDWFNGIQEVLSAKEGYFSRRVADGKGSIYLFAILGVIFLIFPAQLTKKFIKPPEGSPFDDSITWLIWGYLLALSDLGLMFLLE
ncbi:membrane hypothetical protein [Sulfurovum sp. enrichment culture clone C5]|uniref:Uncharacterized protein n=1 Tax=Sulfurovum sp. enrichment culture clone C5 TaxID=497650 RepID=A0A0S4XPG3_9BACT|nr:membrane hypothetical protein [Sulfurovum sp. enrichment culture clone C5]